MGSYIGLSKQHCGAALHYTHPKLCTLFSVLDTLFSIKSSARRAKRIPARSVFKQTEKTKKFRVVPLRSEIEAQADKKVP